MRLIEGFTDAVFIIEKAFLALKELQLVIIIDERNLENLILFSCIHTTDRRAVLSGPMISFHHFSRV